MDDEKRSEKKGFFNRLVVKSKTNKKSSCCNIELEEISEENDKTSTENRPEQPKTDS